MCIRDRRCGFFDRKSLAPIPHAPFLLCLFPTRALGPRLTLKGTPMALNDLLARAGNVCEFCGAADDLAAVTVAPAGDVLLCAECRGETDVPVSYTHLDVYKRQRQARLRARPPTGLKAPAFIRAAGGRAGATGWRRNRAGKFRPGSQVIRCAPSWPVSYTHLDVYKRQDQGFGLGNT